MRVIDDYMGAIERQDLSRMRSLAPDLTADQEKRLRDSFKTVKQQITIVSWDGFDIRGDRALVRLTSQSTVNGNPQATQARVLHLTREGGSWSIRLNEK